MDRQKRIEQLQSEIDRLQQERLDCLKLKKIYSISGMSLKEVANWLDELQMNYNDHCTIYVQKDGEFFIGYE